MVEASGKNGALSLIFVGAIVLLGIGVIAAIGGDITYDIRNTLTTSERVTNQSITFTNNTEHSISGGEITSVVSVANATFTFNSGNYTLTATDFGSSLLISIRCGAAATTNNCTGVGSTLNVTYDVLQNTRASLAASNSTLGISSLQLPNVGTVYGAMVVVLIIFSIIGGAAFARKAGKGGGRGE